MTLRELIILLIVAGICGSIGRAISDRGEQLSAFYISNVENYLFRDGLFAKYADNVSHLPRNARTLVIRSIFSGGGESASRVQPLDQMLGDITRGSYRTYSDLLRASGR